MRFLLFDLCQLTLYEVYRVLLFISPSEEVQKLALLLPQFGERTLESVRISEQSLVRTLLPLAFQVGSQSRHSERREGDGRLRRRGLELMACRCRPRADELEPYSRSASVKEA